MRIAGGDVTVNTNGHARPERFYAPDSLAEGRRRPDR